MPDLKLLLIVAAAAAWLGSYAVVWNVAHSAGYDSRNTEIQDLKDQRQADADKRAREIEEQKAATAADAAARAAEVATYGASDSARALCFDDAGLRLFNAGPRAGLPVPGGGPGRVQPSGDARPGEVGRAR